MTHDAEIAAVTHARLDEMRNLLRKIEEDQTLVLLNQFDNRYYKKDLGRDFRVVFSKHTRGDYCLLCAFAFLSRGDQKYDELWQGIRFGCADDRYHRIDDQESETFAERIRVFEHNPEPPRPPNPSPEESIWLTQEGTPATEVMVLETESWIQAQGQQQFKRSGNAIHRVFQQKIYEQVECFHRQGSQPQGDLLIPYLEPGYVDLDDEEIRIHFQYFPSHHVLVLLDLTTKNVNTPTPLIEGHDRSEDHQHSTDVDRETLIRNTRRAYPLDVFLLDSEEYFQIQDQKEGNLSLSPEESDVLALIYYQSQSRFPLFINGRAGSGKSTLLHYLIKDYLYLCFAHWSPNPGYTPLYLTYSENLLKTARSHVVKLLEANAGILLKRDEQWHDNYIAHKDEVFDQTFKLFREFLVSLLPLEVRAGFSREQRIGYAQFKRLWEQRAPWKEKKKFGVDLVWHILRTYIKGMAHAEQDYLNPEAYKALPRRYKSVTDTDYTEVFNHVWQRWYRPYCEENGYWDDQDLAVKVLTEGTFPRCYPAIFCDEAQDFTALELKILYHLSLFSDRTVPAYSIGHVPFVFAGDPLQTLNPTGFRWEAVKSSFHDYLLKPLEHRVRSTSGFNYQELAANYRSSKQVVDFCNYIQLLRLCLFGENYNVRPQEAWFPSPTATRPFLLSVNHPQAKRLLSYSALVIIPNCHEDEETELVANDPLLNTTVERDEEGIPSTVLSPTMAKGLEYDEIVILYRFGATCPPSLAARLRGEGGADPGPSITIEWEYFLNRLYVAASRARRRLVILDDPTTFQTFWGIMQNMDAEQLAQHLQANINPSDWGGDRILLVQEGHSEEVEALFNDRATSDDHAEIHALAEKWYREGMDAEDSRLLRRARTLFQRLSDQSRATECHAHALQLEGQYADAAKRFLEIDDQERALQCLWAIPDFELVTQTQWRGDWCSDLRVVLAKCLTVCDQGAVWNGDPKETARAIKRLNAKMAEDQVMEGNGWRHAATALLNWSKHHSSANPTLVDWTVIHSVARKFDYPNEQLATIAYGLKRFDEARRLWEDADKTSHDAYHRSLYATSTWPDTLKPLKAVSDYDQIVQDWQQQGQGLDTLRNNESLGAILIEALIETGLFQPAVEMLSRERLVTSGPLLVTLTQRLWRHINHILEASNDLATSALRLHLVALVETGEWQALGPILERIDSWRDRLDLDQRASIERALVECIAFNDAIAEAPGEARDPLSVLLRKRLYRDNRRWTTVVEMNLSLPIVGAAIERANRLNDALDYYTWAVRLPGLRPEERTYFDERVAACLSKRIRWSLDQGKHTSDDERKLSDLRRQLGDRFIELDPDPSRYPGTGVLPSMFASRLLETELPMSKDETKADQRLRACDPHQNEQEWRMALGVFVKALAEHDKWNTLTQDLTHEDTFRKRFPSLTAAQTQTALELIVCQIIEPLACSRGVTGSGARVLQTLSELIVPRLRDDQNRNQWNGCAHLGIDRDIAGAAIERLGHDVTAIQFYEWALEQEATRRGRRMMAERLIVARERYAEYLANSEKPSQRDRAQEQRLRAQRLREEHQLVGSELPEYPDLA